MASDNSYTYPSTTRPCTFRPYLHTARLTLEIMDDHSPIHIDQSLKILNDPVSTNAMGDFGIKTPEQHIMLSDATMLLPQHLPAGESPSGSLAYLVRLGTNDPAGEIVGLVSLASRSKDVPPDMGWGFHSAHHGKGYATEASKELLRYLMHDLQGGFLHAKPPIGIMAWPTPSNQASIRVAEKIGMVYVGEITGDDEEVEVVYGVPELLGGRTFTKDTVVSFYGPGEAGQRCKAALTRS